MPDLTLLRPQPGHAFSVRLRTEGDHTFIQVAGEWQLCPSQGLQVARHEKKGPAVHLSELDSRFTPEQWRCRVTRLYEELLVRKMLRPGQIMHTSDLDRPSRAEEIPSPTWARMQCWHWEMTRLELSQARVIRELRASCLRQLRSDKETESTRVALRLLQTGLSIQSAAEVMAAIRELR